MFRGESGLHFGKDISIQLIVLGIYNFISIMVCHTNLLFIAVEVWLIFQYCGDISLRLESSVYIFLMRKKFIP